MQPNRRVAPLNSLALSTGSLSQSHGSGVFAQRLTTPARSTALQQTFNATTSPTRRPNRNSSDGVAAILGGGLSSPTAPRPSTRSRSEGPGLLRQNSSQGARTTAAPDSLIFTTPAFTNATLSSPGKTALRPINIAYGTGCTQGPRPTMEDAHFAIVNAKDVEGNPVALFGILDGHCGRKVADLAAQFFPEFLLSHPDLTRNTAVALVDAGIRTDHRVFQTIQHNDGGSTAIIAVIKPKSIHVGCIGDARSVLCDNGKAIAMSVDHKPTDPSEQQRIMRCGGMVHFGRVGGCLAVSRALGDFEFKFNGQRYVHKEYQVSNVADVMSINISDTTHFLILACDGLWDVMTNEEAVSFVNDFIASQLDHAKNGVDRERILNHCAQRLAEAAVDRGSMDNVSVTLVAFHDWVKQ
jgi:serine/threonine protein phosphatase PrpC